MKKPIDLVRQRYKELVSERESWNAHYQELSEYILPHNGRNLTGGDSSKENNGSKVNDLIIDGTATYAVNVFAAGMQSGVTSPARPWFKVGLTHKELQNQPKIKNWLWTVEKEIYHILAKSNFYNTAHSLYKELGCFGTGAAIMYGSPTNVLRCLPFTVGEYYMSTNADLEVDTFYHVFYQTVRQMVEEYGLDMVSDFVRQQYEDGFCEKRVRVVNGIFPRPDWYEGEREGRYLSVYFEEKGTNSSSDFTSKECGSFLKVRCFEDFPVICPRWDVVSRDIYGTSPCMDLLGDVKMLQLMQEKSLMAIDKMADPPIKAPADMEDGLINPLPGGVTYDQSPTSNSGLGPLYQVSFDVNAVEAKIHQVQEGIKRGLYNDLFMMISANTSQGKRMTATEVAERHEEKLLMLGPAMERLQTELLDKVIKRAYTLGVRAGKIPPPPEELTDNELNVEYVSILAQAQKMVSLTSIENMASFVGNLSGIYPEARFKFDPFDAIDAYADGLGVNPKIMVSTEEARGMQQAEQQAAAQQQQMQQAMASAESAKVLSETDASNPNNMLNKVMQGMGGMVGG